MALLLSSIDVAIRLAHQNGTLKMGTRVGRDGNPYTFLEDGAGLLEVFSDNAAAGARLVALIPGLVDVTVSNVRWRFNTTEAAALRCIEGSPDFLVKYGR